MCVCVKWDGAQVSWKYCFFLIWAIEFATVITATIIIYYTNMIEREKYFSLDAATSDKIITRCK